MTTPEYSPVFSKVKAIVTDEGGVTCHAAVVAREHQIPTIVGTKKASQVITNSQEIELDLSSGTISILTNK